jgi:hypothetical protein
MVLNRRRSGCNLDEAASSSLVAPEALMNRTLLIFSAGILAFAAPALAQLPPQAALTWSDCPLGTYTSDITNSCTTNTGAVGTMVASYVPPVGLDTLVAESLIIDMRTNSSALSPWWHMESGGCGQRVGAIVAGANFTANPPYSGCHDSWGLNAVAGVNYQPNGLNGATIKAIAAVPLELAGVVTPDKMWYAISITISNAGTVNGGCPGCTDAACFDLRQLNLSEPAPIPDLILYPITYQHCRYNGVGPPATCPLATPTRTSTWGSLKALYR